MSAKILIVDDEPFNVDLLEQQLEEQSYQTCTAANGLEALAALDKEQPDLVLLDWMMPGMNGLEVLGRMRAEPRWQGLPVIMLTARGTTQDKVEGLDAGADDYVTKPIDEGPSYGPAYAPCCVSPAYNKKITPCVSSLRVAPPTRASLVKAAPWSKSTP
jgi:CheY-like chemotaxis protein